MDLREKEAVVLLVFSGERDSPLLAALPPEIVAGSDTSGKARRDFLGGTSAGRAVFVTDRYGEISAQWVITNHQFPTAGQILGSLARIEIACEECGVPNWPVDE